MEQDSGRKSFSEALDRIELAIDEEWKEGAEPTKSTVLAEEEVAQIATPLPKAPPHKWFSPERDLIRIIFLVVSLTLPLVLWWRLLRDL